MSILLVSGIIIAFAILIIIGAAAYQHLIAIPRCRKELGEALDEELAHTNADIDKVVEEINRRFENEDDPLRAMALAAMAANYRYVRLHNLFSARKSELESRFDFNKAFVQEYYQANNAQLSELPAPETFDMSEHVQAHILKAYKALSESFTALSQTKEITDTHGIARLSPASFFYLEVGKLPIVRFNNAKGDLISIYPTFVIVYRGDSDVEFLNITDISLRVSSETYTEHDTSKKIPDDAIITGYQWQHMTKKGEPDARYTYNPRYTTYSRGILTFSPGAIRLCFSNSFAPLTFNTYVLNLISANLNDSTQALSAKNSVDVPSYSTSDNPVMEIDVEKLQNYIADNAMFLEILRYIAAQQTASITQLQRTFQIGFKTAAEFMDRLEDTHVVGPAYGTRPRKVNITLADLDSVLRF